MLTEIHITNLATIEEVHLELHDGTTVITGETGAGKSILIDAIELALGERASPHLIRTGQDKIDIRLCFDGQQEHIVKRVIMRDGRSKTYLNDLPITLPALRAFSESLIDIHGQHEHQTLLKPEKQRDLLDRFGNHQNISIQVQELANQYWFITQAIQTQQAFIQQHDERRDFLRYQLNELETLQLQTNEWQTLEIEHQQLAHTDTLLQHLTLALAELTQQEEKNALALLHRAIKSLETIKHVHPQIAQWSAITHTAAIQLDDTAVEIRHYLDTIDLNPERLQWLEQRMQSLHDMARKYKVTPVELPLLLEKIKADLQTLENDGSSLVELEQKQKNALQQYLQTANQLSEKRLQAGKKLAGEITHIIQTLSLPHAEFQIDLQKETETTVSLYGLEKTIFQVKTNQGSSFYPLAKIASGGELSRISLAIHLATAAEHSVSTLIFDEVDVGIGGSTAEKVGQLLRRLGKTRQVLCITHQPQVAAYGHHHLSVEKISRENQTYTHIHSLDLSDKIKEIARMLGGIQITPTTLKHAQEMVEAV